jgi:hypothetical protein
MPRAVSTALTNFSTACCDRIRRPVGRAQNLDGIPILAGLCERIAERARASQDSATSRPSPSAAWIIVPFTRPHLAA